MSANLHLESDERTETLPSLRPRADLGGIFERQESGITILTPSHGKPTRRLLYVNSYGGKDIWNQVKQGLPSNHLWGCLQLVKHGYEVALAEALPDFYLYRNPLPHDLKLLKMTRSWLGRDGILYCGHNVLYWLPFLRAFGAIRCPVVSLLFAREPLAFSGQHTGIIALTRAAAEHAAKLAPQTKVAHLGWGADLDTLPKLKYAPEWFLCCGLTERDHRTLSLAAAQTQSLIRVIARRPPDGGLTWLPNVEVITRNQKGELVGPTDLLQKYYPRNAGSIIPIREDPFQYIACGFTELLEAMATARPVILTRTGALPTEIDVEKAGCGLQVPPTDPKALAGAINTLANDPVTAEAMGERGRILAERYYNMDRFGAELHKFFEDI